MYNPYTVYCIYMTSTSTCTCIVAKVHASSPPTPRTSRTWAESRAARSPASRLPSPALPHQSDGNLLRRDTSRDSTNSNTCCTTSFCQRRTWRLRPCIQLLDAVALPLHGATCRASSSSNSSSVNDIAIRSNVVFVEVCRIDRASPFRTSQVHGMPSHLFRAT